MAAVEDDSSSIWHTIQAIVPVANERRSLGPRVHLAAFLIAPTALRYACNDNAITQPGAAGQGDTRPIFFVAGRNAIIESDAEGKSCRSKDHWGWMKEENTKKQKKKENTRDEITSLTVVARLAATYYFINFGATGASVSISAVIGRLAVTYYYIQIGATCGGSPVGASTQDIDPYDVKVGEILVLVSTGPPIATMPEVIKHLGNASLSSCEMLHSSPSYATPPRPNVAWPRCSSIFWIMWLMHTAFDSMAESFAVDWLSKNAWPDREIKGLRNNLNRNVHDGVFLGPTQSCDCWEIDGESGCAMIDILKDHAAGRANKTY
ncbi:hypothetical protein PG990_009065 [Apiospora arundinis]